MYPDLYIPPNGPYQAPTSAGDAFFQAHVAHRRAKAARHRERVAYRQARQASREARQANYEAREFRIIADQFRVQKNTHHHKTGRNGGRGRYHPYASRAQTPTPLGYGNHDYQYASAHQQPTPPSSGCSPVGSGVTAGNYAGLGYNQNDYQPFAAFFLQSTENGGGRSNTNTAADPINIHPNDQGNWAWALQARAGGYSGSQRIKVEPQ